MTSSGLDEALYARLREIAPVVGTTFGYEYDFGDGWLHLITVEEILTSSTDPVAPPRAVCLDGARCCPPEDCGGIPGYEDTLRALKQPKKREYRERLEWLGGAYDPEAFDATRISSHLAQLPWPKVTIPRLAKVLSARDIGTGT